MNADGTNATTRSSPLLFDGHAVVDLVVPIRADALHDRGVAAATRYGEEWGLPLQLVHVGSSTPAEGVIDLSVSEARARLVAAHPALEVHWLEIDHDDIAGGIAAAAIPGSLVVMATDRASEWRTGDSVGEQVLEAVDEAVLLCGPNCRPPALTGSVVVPLDGSARAEQALPYGAALAAASGDTLRIVSVVRPETVGHVATLRSRGEAVSESGYLRSVAARLAAGENTFVGPVDVGWEIIHGADVAAAISEFVHDRSAKAIVTTTHGATGLARTLFGSVCMGLVENSSTPVLVVKTPPGADIELTG